MKRQLLLLFILFSGCVTYAQVPRGFSLAAGLNSSSLNSNQLKGEGAMGFAAGFGFNWGYHETHNYEVNVLYTKAKQEFAFYDEFDPTVTGKQQFDLVTLDFILNFNYYIIKPDEDKLYLGAQAGGFVTLTSDAWKPSKKADDTRNIYPVEGGHVLDGSGLSMTKNFNYGPSLGVVAGYNSFRLAVKYNIGLANVLKDVETNEHDEFNRYTGPELEGKISMITATLYYKIF